MSNSTYISIFRHIVRFVFQVINPNILNMCSLFIGFGWEGPILLIQTRIYFGISNRKSCERSPDFFFTPRKFLG